MIADRLANIDCYRGLGERIATALDFLRNTNFAELPDGRTDIRGDEIFAMLMRYDTKPREVGRWEAHRSYIDIQFLIEGNELIGVTDAAGLTITEEYDSDKDIMFFADADGDFLQLSADKFVLLFPQDAHMPYITDKTTSAVRKVVIKILV
jgi:YhcH/YjgK/YiaL family protein